MGGHLVASQKFLAPMVVLNFATFESKPTEGGRTLAHRVLAVGLGQARQLSP